MKSYDVTEWGKPLQLRARETPKPKGREVLMRLTHSGVCHTDVHMRDGYFDIGGGRKLSVADWGLAPPLTLGHEPLGVVAAVGEAVRGVKPGDRCVVNPWIGCGVCRMCAAGKDNLCQKMRPLGMGAPGAFATHLLVPEARYLVNVEGLDPATTAPLACSGVTTYSAVRKLQPIDPEDWVAVIGCGGLGLMALAVLKALDHDKLIACDIDDAKLVAAREHGAKESCNLKTEGLKRLAAIAGGNLYGMLDFVGAPATVALALPALRKGGRLVVAGLMGGEATLPIPVLAMSECSISGNNVGSTRDLIELVELARSGRLRVPEVQRRPLSAADRALSDLAAGKVVGRVVLEVPEEC